MKLRDYQQDIVDKVVGSNNQSLMVEACTGSGKSIMIAYLAKYYHNQGYEVIISTDISALIDQLYDTCRTIDLDPTVIKASDKRKGKDDIYIAMDQTLINRAKEMSFNNVVLLSDEGHKRTEADRYIEIKKYIKPVKEILFSGTPFRPNGIRFDMNYIIGEANIENLTNKGYLAPYKLIVPSVIKTLDFNSLSSSTGDYNLGDIKKLYDTKEFEKYFKQFYFENVGSKQTLIVCSNIDHAELIGLWLKDIKINASVIHSKRSSKENDTNIANFKNNSLNCLVSISKINIGFDASNTEVLINLRPTESYNLYFQIAGRLVRKHPENKDKFLYDFTDNIFRLEDPRKHFTGFKDEIDKQLYEDKKKNDEEFYFSKTDDELVDLDPKKIEIYLEEFKKGGLLNELKYEFELTNDIEELLDITFKAHKAIRGWVYKQDRLDEIVSDCLEYEDRFILINKRRSYVKALKTRINNILRDPKKKLYGVKYFPSWFYEATLEKYPWLANELEEQEEIPF